MRRQPQGGLFCADAAGRHGAAEGWVGWGNGQDLYGFI